MGTNIALKGKRIRRLEHPPRRPMPTATKHAMVFCQLYHRRRSEPSNRLQRWHRYSFTLPPRRKIMGHASRLCAASIAFPCPGSTNVFLGEALPTNRSPRESYRGVILTRGRGKLCEVEVVCVQPLRYNRTREWSPADTKGRSYNCALRPHVSLGTENDSIKRITNYRTTGPR